MVDILPVNESFDFLFILLNLALISLSTLVLCIFKIHRGHRRRVESSCASKASCRLVGVD